MTRAKALSSLSSWYCPNRQIRCNSRPRISSPTLVRRSDWGVSFQVFTHSRRSFSSVCTLRGPSLRSRLPGVFAGKTVALVDLRGTSRDEMYVELRVFPSPGVHGRLRVSALVVADDMDLVDVEVGGDVFVGDPPSQAGTARERRASAREGVRRRTHLSSRSRSSGVRISSASARPQRVLPRLTTYPAKRRCRALFLPWNVVYQAFDLTSRPIPGGHVLT